MGDVATEEKSYTMTSYNPIELTLGYDFDAWNNYGIKNPVIADVSPHNNSHMLITGMSGSGKSTQEQRLLAKLYLAEPNGEFFFADYKRDDSFLYLRPCENYFSYNEVWSALTIVHGRLQARQSGEDLSRTPVTFVFDEYIAAILNLLSEDKKRAENMMRKVSEILLLGRSLSVRLIVTCQRPDMIAFPMGSRLNYGLIIVLGGAAKSIYEMVAPDFLDKIRGKHFERGEGIVVEQGAKLHFVIMPIARNMDKVRELCIAALSKCPAPREAQGAEAFSEA